MDDDPLLGWGLRNVELSDQATLGAYFASLAEPLSDYTFSQLYSWRNSLRILWKEIDGHLCVFANGAGDLTLLMPPIGDGGGDRAMARAFELMDAYNAAKGVPERSRVEYASEELIKRYDSSKLIVQPLGMDYLYDVNRMIDLAGGDLASKRQAKNRFMRNYPYRVEKYSSDLHLSSCLSLLNNWKQHQDSQRSEDPSTNAIKRQKETLACELTLRSAEALGLKGMVVWVRGEGSGVRGQGSVGEEEWGVRGFTFGEVLGKEQSSIVIEKTDLTVKGLAQFIFSEFCRMEWSDRPLVNVGDDWGLETLAWTKMSYRPVKLLKKYVLRQPAKVRVSVPEPMGPARIPVMKEIPVATEVRAAQKADVGAAVELESRCFSSYCLSKRQLQYLQQRSSAVFLVAEQKGRIVGDGIALVRQHKYGRSGRIYSLAVCGECRGQKIGQRLLKQMVHELQGRGVKRIYLEVEQSNAAAIHLYEQNGFRSIGVMPDYYGAGRNGLHMMSEVGVKAAVREEVGLRGEI